MAGNITKFKNDIDGNVLEYVVDTVEEVELLPTTKKKGTGAFASIPAFQINPEIGSTCIVGNGDDKVLVYMLFSNGWKRL